MKLTFSPASPFARKVRIAAIELGLIDRIEFVPTAVAPAQSNDEYSRITPVKKLPVLILDNGDVILDSYVIVEYLDELAGGGKLWHLPAHVRRREPHADLLVALLVNSGASNFFSFIRRGRRSSAG